MKSNKFLQVIILSFSILFGVSAHADPINKTEAKDWTYDKGRMLLKAFTIEDMRKKYSMLDDLFINHIDLDYIGKFVIGKYWRQMTPEQQIKYNDLFRRYSLAIYKSFPLEFKGSVDFEVKNVELKEQHAEVFTAVKVPDPEVQNMLDSVSISFRLDKKNGVIKIVDLKLGEASLILSYRNRFYKMVMDDQEDMGWFLEDLEAATTSTERNNELQLKQSGY